MSDAQEVLREVRVSATPHRVREVAPASGRFVAGIETAVCTEERTIFPRTWTQLEAQFEKRLSEFEARHRNECAEAFERGRSEGRREQADQLETRLREAGEIWRAIQAGVRKELAAYREELYRGTTELASALARTWLGSIVEIHPRVFEAGLRKALEALGHQEQIEVKLHPEDYEAFRSGLNDRDQILWELSEVTVTPDPSVDRGGAVAMARGGTADARLSVRVQKALEWLNPSHDPR